MSLSSNFKVGDYEHPETIGAQNEEMSEGFLNISFGTTVPGLPVNFSGEVSVGSPGEQKLGDRIELSLTPAWTINDMNR